MPALILLVLVTVGGPLVVMWLMRPDAIVRRGRNALVGIRIPSTMASDEAWEEGHRAAWPATRTSSVAAVVLFLVLLGAGLAAGGSLGWDAAGVVVAAALVSMVVWTVGVLVGARKASLAAHQVAARAGTRPW